MTSILQNQFVQLRLLLKSYLQTVNKVTVSIHCQSTVHDSTLCSITISFYSIQQQKEYSLLVDLFSFEGHQNGTMLLDRLLTLLSDYQLLQKVLCIVSSIGPSEMECQRLFDQYCQQHSICFHSTFQWVFCFLDCLQLAAESMLCS